MTDAFGGWLVSQARRHDWIGLLADQASKDPRFPKGGDPNQVRTHLEAKGADGDTFEALEAAEREWGRA